MGVGIEHDTLARLTARLDAQEEELVALRALLADRPSEERGGPAVIAPVVATSRVERGAPVSRRTPATSRRGLLKGAGAALFTTALLATGEIIPVTPFRVAAATPYPAPPHRTTAAVAATSDTLYQTFVGTDFQPETTANGYADLSTGLGSSAFAAGQIDAATAPGNFSARLDLPQGATLTELLFYVIHNDNNYMAADVAGYATDGSLNGIGGTVISSSGPGITTINVPLFGPPTVDNTTYSYVIRWIATSAGTTQQLYGARVGYTLPNSAQLYGSAQAGIGAYGVSATGIGLLGQSDSATGRGVKGLSAAGFPIIGTVTDGANINAGVLGVGTAGPGVQGQSATGHGTVGTSDTTDGHAGIVGNATHTGGIGVMGIAPGYGGGSVGVAGGFFGNVRIYGGNLSSPAMQTVVPHTGDNTYRVLQTMVSPDGWAEDFGKGTLAGGKVDISLDPDFAALVHTDDYHVFLTPHGPQSLYVPQQSATGFTVIATPTAPTGGGLPPPTAGTFSWRVVAKRKDIAGARLAKVGPPPTPKTPSAVIVPETPAAAPPKKP